MKLLKLLPFALLALGFAACGSDNDDPEPTPDHTGVYVTTVFGTESAYASDEVNVTVRMDAENGLLTLVVDEVTGSPARGDIPAQMMTDLTIENIPVTAGGKGSYTFNAEEATGHGTMRGKVSPFKRCQISGQLTGKDLVFTLVYKFTDSDMEPLLTSSYAGTCILAD